MFPFKNYKARKIEEQVLRYIERSTLPNSIPLQLLSQAIESYSYDFKHKKLILTFKILGELTESLTLFKTQMEDQLKEITQFDTIIIGFVSYKSPIKATAAPVQPEVRPVERPVPQMGIDLPDIKQVILVASGKGGVGKSTVSLCLAQTLQAKGLKVGLLDADIYGPSLPRLTQITTKPDYDKELKKILPHSFHGIKVMSVGYLTEDQAPLIWRGPMVQNAVKQMLKDVAWGELDTLIIDLPPGTGDIQLTLAQQLKNVKGIIVSTPQDLALIDAQKAIDMFKRVNIPILGMVENMSSFECPNCNHISHIFDQNGAKSMAERLNLPFLGAIPLDMEFRLALEQARPFIALNSTHPISRKYTEIADGLIS